MLEVEFKSGAKGREADEASGVFNEHSNRASIDDKDEAKLLLHYRDHGKCFETVCRQLCSLVCLFL